MTEVDQDELPAEGFDRRLLVRLLRYLKPYRPWLAGSLGLLLLQAGLTIVGPVLTQRALDRATPSRDGALLLRYSLLYVGALFLSFGVQYGDALLTVRIGQRVMYDLRMEIFRHLQRLSVPFFDRNPVGRLMTRVTADVETLNELFSSGVVTVFGDLFTLGAITALMLATAGGSHWSRSRWCRCSGWW